MRVDEADPSKEILAEYKTPKKVVDPAPVPASQKTHDSNDINKHHKKKLHNKQRLLNAMRWWTTHMDSQEKQEEAGPPIKS